MSLLASMREALRDHTPDRVAEALRRAGVEATRAAHGRPEATLTGASGSSVGVIEIKGSPIAWINVRKGKAPLDSGLADLAWFLEYGVPDARMPAGLPSIALRFATGRWSGAEHGTGLAYALTDDMYETPDTVRSDAIDVRAHPARSCWVISTDYHTDFVKERWQLYELIARRLLKTR